MSMPVLPRHPESKSLLPSTPKPGGTVPYLKDEMPDCSGWKAFVLDGAFYGSCVALMAEAGFQRAMSVQEADVVVFIGGEDINPSLYDQKCLTRTSYTESRDTYEEYVYNQCLMYGTPMFGICRGMQFLHAMNGGKLWQHVNNHGGKDHYIVDIEDDVRVKVTSLHHQMLQFNDTMQLIAVAEEQTATHFEDDSMLVVDPEHELEIEAGAYLDSKCFFVQGHPEIGSSQFRAWTMNKLYDFLVDAIPFMDDPEMKEIRISESKKVIQS